METYFNLGILVIVSVCMITVKSEIETLRNNNSMSSHERKRNCVDFNDCCVEARMRSPSQNRKSSHFVCMQNGDMPNRGAYAVQTCSRNFLGPADVQRKCRDQIDISDPFMVTPVIHSSTKKTYINRYCAECNNVDPSILKSWSILMGCSVPPSIPVTKEFIWKNIQYRPNLNKWGVEINGRFHVCEMQFKIPDYLSNSVRTCTPNHAPSCRRNYFRSYVGYFGVWGRVRKPFSFPLLLDINLSDGEIVGIFRHYGSICSENQKYDPYFRKCRDLVCALPGYIMVNGKCKRSL